PSRHPVPRRQIDRLFGQALVSLSIRLFPLPHLQRSKVRAHRLSDERGPVELESSRGPVGGLQQSRFDDDLDRLHVWSLLHSRLHSQGASEGGASTRVARVLQWRMVKTITQRELRNGSGKIMRALDGGESFVVTRNGVPVGELRPLPRREF